MLFRSAQTRAACAAEGLTPWEDPTNADPVFTRARVRHRVLPVLEAELGPGIAEALARSADLLRADADALDEQADAAFDTLATVTGAGEAAQDDGVIQAGGPARPDRGRGGGRRDGEKSHTGVQGRPGAHRSGESGAGAVEFDVAALAALPAAIRTRVLRRAALAAGSSASALRAEHVWAVEELVTRWRGQKPVPLPSGVLARRTGGRIALVGPRSGGGDARARTRTRRDEEGILDEEGIKVSQAVTATPNREGGEGGIGGASRPSPHPDIAEVLVTEEEIAAKITELAARVDADYAGREVLLVGVLKGAVMVMADLSRALTVPLTMEFMAVSSYGSATSSSGVVRILKDLDRSIEGRDVLVVEDIIDSGLTLSWLLRNLSSRNPASLEVLALFRKPEALAVDIDVRYVGFDIPSAFVVGYGLDYAEHYRTLPFVGTLTPEAIARRAGS